MVRVYTNHGGLAYPYALHLTPYSLSLTPFALTVYICKK